MTPLEELTREGATVINRCEILLDGAVVDDPPIIDGTVTYDATRQNVRDCDVQLAGAVPAVSSDPLAPTQHTLRLYRGARDYTGEELYEPVGVYAFDETNVERLGRVSQISGYDMAEVVADARWEDPWVIASGTNVGTALRDALLSRLPLLTEADLNFVTTSETTPSIAWGLERDNNPMKDMGDLAAASGLLLTFARDGRPTLASVPDPDTAEIAWSFTAGEEPTFLDASKTLKGRPCNVVHVYTEPNDGTAPIRAVAEDDNPLSASYVGRYRKPRFMPVGYIKNAGQALAAAQGELNRRLGLAELVAVTCAGISTLDVFKVATVDDPRLRVDGRFMVDAYRLPLRAGRAELVTRRRMVA